MPSLIVGRQAIGASSTILSNPWIDQHKANVAASCRNHVDYDFALPETRISSVNARCVGYKQIRRPNPESGVTEMRNARFCCVSDAFPFVNRSWQLHLVDTAVIVTVQTMALHSSRDACESFFHAAVDQVYAAASQEDPPLSDSERHQIYCDAQSVKKRVRSRMMDDYFESVRSLSRQKFMESRPFHFFLRTVSETLDCLRTYFLPAASGIDLHRLFARCKAACTLLNLWELGKRDDNETAIPVKTLYSDVVAVIAKIENGLMEGQFFVRDGRIKLAAYH
jgi:hypothetical protein